MIYHAMINGNEQSSNIFTVFPNIYRNSRRITVADRVKSSYLAKILCVLTLLQ